jgi:membrane protein YqaA with SNARE-associated domain
MAELLYFLTEYGYIGLFIAAFLAATILPFSSEVVFTALLYSTQSDVWLCIISATLGNWLGGLTCYWLGRLGKTEWITRFLRVPPDKVEHWQNKIQGKAALAAFFSFLPGIGDLIAIAAGYLRANFWLTSVSILVGKFLRFVVWVYITYWYWA